MNMPKQYQFWLNMLIVIVFTITVMLHHFTVIHNKELISLERRVPSLGLDFVLEYNITGGHRNRSKKQSTEPTKQSLGEKCNSPKKLHNIDLLSQQELELEGRIVMTETSGSAALNPRQACGVESAARRSGMDVVVVMMNESLLLTDNTTCHLVTQYNNIQFFSVNITNLALNTSLEKFITTPGILTKLVPAHKSDILRSLLVYKFGGLYLDTDILTLNDLTHYHDFLVNWQPPGKSPMMLNSCAFSFRRGHPLLKMVIDKIEASYNPSVWTSIGPSLFTACLKEFTGIQDINQITISTGIHIVHWKEMLTAYLYDPTIDLFHEDPKSFDWWENLFRNSTAVHFGNSVNGNVANIDDPQYSAYAVIGPQYCPMSYFSDQNF